MNKFTFFGSISLILIFATLMIVLGPKISNGISSIGANIGYYLSWFFIAVASLCLVFVLYISFSKFGKIKLHDSIKKEKKEYSNFSWASMIFAGGLGAGILWGGLTEWDSYLGISKHENGLNTYKFLLEEPIRNSLEEVSSKAISISQAYSIFHWGPLPWAMHASAAIPIAYMYYVKKTPILKISQSCGSLLGKHKNGILGKIIDTFFIIGLILAFSTSLGLGTQTVSSFFSKVSGTNPNSKLQQSIILLIIYAIFSVTAFFGLKKGMAILSKSNSILTFLVLIFILLVGPTLFIVKNGLSQIGNFLFFLPKMITFTDPLSSAKPDADFIANWTSFYWAWWGAYVLYMGMLIAKISKGRSIRQMVLGTIGYGTLGVLLCFIILGGFGLGHFKGIGEGIQKYIPHGKTTFAVAAEIIALLPAAKFIIIIIAISAIVYMSISFNGAAFAMAASTMKKIKQDESPPKWLKLFYSSLVVLMLLGMIMVGAKLNIITSMTVMGGIPMLILLILMIVSWIKNVKKDMKNGFLESHFREPNIIELNTK